MNNFDEFKVLYDRSADVLYISKRQTPAARGVEEPFGLVWRYDSNGELIGATIMDFEDYWSDKHFELATKLSDKFNVPTKQTTAFLDHVLSEKRH